MAAVFEDVLISELRDLGFRPDDDTIRRFRTYYDMLISANEKMNLTSVTDEEKAAILHFADSLSLVRLLGSGELRGGRLADVGTGAGFPGLVLSIAFPGAEFCLVDSQARKLAFVDEVIGALGLEGVRTLHMRAEDMGRNEAHRERYDVVVSRAVADLAVLAEYCLPLVRQGGVFVAYKSGGCTDEIVRAETAVSLLGGRIERTEYFSLAGGSVGRCLIMMRKCMPTPRKYPRKAGTPRKTPLV